MICNPFNLVDKTFCLIKPSNGNKIINKPERAEQERAFLSRQAVITGIAVEESVMAQFTPY